MTILRDTKQPKSTNAYYRKWAVDYANAIRNTRHYTWNGGLGLEFFRYDNMNRIINLNTYLENRVWSYIWTPMKSSLTAFHGAVNAYYLCRRLESDYLLTYNNYQKSSLYKTYKDKIPNFDLMFGRMRDFVAMMINPRYGGCQAF